jgi:uncharacterized protein (TIGR03083 family)
VDSSEHISRLKEEGLALALAAERAGLDETVTSVPDWTVREVVAHQGQVHRWALSCITSGRTEPPADSDAPAEVPGDGTLLDWFRDGHQQLVSALLEADPDLKCWSFLPAPTPLAFWARRQAHETAIHRADAESALGARPTYPKEFAADGIDELLLGFFARPRGRLVADPPVRLAIVATDTGDAWTMTIGPDSRSTVRERTEADTTVAGLASDLYLLLWNRRDSAGFDIDGDSGVLDLWQERARINWS